MIHYLVKQENGIDIVHAQHALQQDVSLCGCDLTGDIGTEAVETTKKINCRYCIEIIEWCKNAKI